MYEQGRGGPTRPTDVSSKSENVPPAQVSVRPYPWPIGALEMTKQYKNTNCRKEKIISINSVIREKNPITFSFPEGGKFLVQQ